MSKKIVHPGSQRRTTLQASALAHATRVPAMQCTAELLFGEADHELNTARTVAELEKDLATPND